MRCPDVHRQRYEFDQVSIGRRCVGVGDGQRLAFLQQHLRKLFLGARDHQPRVGQIESLRDGSRKIERYCKILQSKLMKLGHRRIGPSFYARHGSLVAQTLAQVEDVPADHVLLVPVDRLRIGWPVYRRDRWRRKPPFIGLPGERLHMNEEFGRWCALTANFPRQRCKGEIRLGRERRLLPGPESVGSRETAIHEEDPIERQLQWL
jgi:hypothetical protein